MANPTVSLDDIESREEGQRIVVQLTFDGQKKTNTYTFEGSRAQDLQTIEGCDCSLEPKSIEAKDEGHELVVTSECENCGVEYVSYFESDG